MRFQTATRRRETGFRHLPPIAPIATTRPLSLRLTAPATLASRAARFAIIGAQDFIETWNTLARELREGLGFRLRIRWSYALRDQRAGQGVFNAPDRAMCTLTEQLTPPEVRDLAAYDAAHWAVSGAFEANAALIRFPSSLSQYAFQIGDSPLS